jgi:hypothetical protein
MSTENGKKALNGERVWIPGDMFVIKEDMTMTFEGGSCNVKNSDGEFVYEVKTDDGNVELNVSKGYTCYVLMGWLKFEKKNS